MCGKKNKKTGRFWSILWTKICKSEVLQARMSLKLRNNDRELNVAQDGQNNLSLK